MEMEELFTFKLHVTTTLSPTLAHKSTLLSDTMLAAATTAATMGVMTNAAAASLIRRRFGLQPLCYYLLHLDCVFGCLACSIYGAVVFVVLVTDFKPACLLLQVTPLTFGALSFGFSATISVNRFRRLRLRFEERKEVVAKQRKRTRSAVLLFLLMMALFFGINVELKAPMGVAVKICQGHENVEGELSLSFMIPMSLVLLLGLITVVFDILNIRHLS